MLGLVLIGELFVEAFIVGLDLKSHQWAGQVYNY